MRFSKWHGIGNDFVVIDEDSLLEPLTPDVAVAICDRHFGVGADGILILGKSDLDNALAKMVIHNADGSLAEMCGNGIRVAARYLVENNMVSLGSDKAFGIETAAGIIYPTLLDDDRVRVDMGAVTTSGVSTIDLGDVDASLLGTMFSGRVVSVGNPHFVVCKNPDGPELNRLGFAIETHPLFPNRTNVEFFEILDQEQSRIRMRVWERGVGETLACGTGACATAFTARLDFGIQTPITVELPGGDLLIEFKDKNALMTGTAHQAWTGELSISSLLSGNPNTNLRVVTT